MTTLAYFEPERRIRLIADASQIGLGAVLVQFQDVSDLNPVIISFASKSLSDTEKRYSQIEKEALALVWGVERFRDYLMGIVFELETDHKPLTELFKPTSKPTPRLERWVLRLQAFQYKIVYRQGKDNIADPFSRLFPITQLNKSEDFDKDVDERAYVNAVVESVAVDVSEIKQAIENDHELQLIKNALITGDWGEAREEAKDYMPFHKELCLLEGHILRGSRLVIPKSLRDRMLELGHEGHPGESKMVARLRDKVWWPAMDGQVKKFVKACKWCLLVSQPGVPEPMHRRRMPSEPWTDIAMDFMGPLPSGEHLLVLVDYYSRFQEVVIMRRITAADTIQKIEPIFVRLGYPRTITLDNGRQFVSTELEDYCRIRNITLNHTTPYWPQANGEVERQNRLHLSLCSFLFSTTSPPSFSLIFLIKEIDSLTHLFFFTPTGHY